MVAATQINGFLIVSFSLTGLARESFLSFPFMSRSNYLNGWGKREKSVVRKILFSRPSFKDMESKMYIVYSSEKGWELFKRA